MGDGKTIKIDTPKTGISKTTKADINKFDLSPGLEHIKSALQRTYPEMKPRDLEIMGNGLLDKLSESIEYKLPVGNLKPSPDGIPELRLWDIKKLGKK